MILTVTTAPLWTLEIASADLVAYRSWCSMRWWGSRDCGICLLSFNPRPLPWHVSRENTGTILLSSLILSFSILIDLVRCGLSPLVPTSLINVFCHHMWIEVPWNQSPFSLVCVPLVFLVASWFYSFDSHWLLWWVDQRKVNPMLPSFGSFVLEPMYACTYFRP